MSWHRRKSLDTITQHEEGRRLVPTLSWPHLVALGIGAIVGTGIYTLIGVGADKACHMPKMFGPDDLAVMDRVRHAFDPEGVANPGKVLPTPRLCGEVPGPYRQHPAEADGLAERM